MVIFGGCHGCQMLEHNHSDLGYLQVCLQQTSFARAGILIMCFEAVISKPVLVQYAQCTGVRSSQPCGVP